MLIELAERVEKATGPDRRLDVQIEIALNPTKPWIIDHKPGRFPRDPIYGTLTDLWEWATDETHPPPEIGEQRYTASLDAAMTLVPEGVRTLLNIAEDAITTAIVDGTQGCADTPALALCAAALRARAGEQQP